MNIAIMRTFVTLRKLAVNYKEIMRKLEKMESEYDGKFSEIFKALNYLLDPPVPPRKRIGYISDAK